MTPLRLPLHSGAPILAYVLFTFANLSTAITKYCDVAASTDNVQYDTDGHDFGDFTAFESALFSVTRMVTTSNSAVTASATSTTTVTPVKGSV